MEILHEKIDSPGLMARQPWVVAFAFGLLHGLGFAAALEEVGLPQTAIPTALFMFNVGVEVGQLIFVVGFLTLSRVWRRQQGALSLPWMTRVPAYGIGTIAMYWAVERVVGFAA